MKNLKRVLSLAMAVAMVASLSVSAFAVDLTSEVPEDDQNYEAVNTSGQSPVVLTADAVSYKVTVPSKLPIHVDADGTVYVATNAAITNESSAGSIEVTDVSISDNGSGWAIQAYDAFKAESKALGTMEFALNLNGDKTTGEADDADANTKSIAHEQLYWPAIAPGVAMGLPYAAKVPAQKTAIESESTLAQVTFTIGQVVAETAEVTGD